MKKKTTGFTLVELLVVVVSIAILMTLLIPSLAKANYYAQLASCKSNLRRIAAGVTAYANDSNGMYPIGGSSTMLGRIRSWDISDDSSFNLLAKYYPTGTYGDYRDITVDYNELWQCQQGLKEVPWEPGDYGAKASYSMYFNIYAGCSNYEWVDGVKVFSEPERVMKRMGEQFTFDGAKLGGSPDNLKYDILASDIAHRMGNSGYNIGTNHTGLGDRTTQMNSAYRPLYWWTTDGRPTVNYAFADGSVKEFSADGGAWDDSMDYATRAGGFGGDKYILPVAWGEE